MFNRNSQTYEFKPEIIEYVYKDAANPLNQIGKLIPSGATVLDIGAGSGLLPLIFDRFDKKVVIDGIEPNSFGASLAKKNYRYLYNGYIQDFFEILQKNQYDFIILADVIEHIQDPLQFLTDIYKRIADKTRIVISTPNIAFGSIRLSLLNGNFDYVDSGILEKTHLRFFTFNTLINLINSIGMNIDMFYHLRRNILNTDFNLKKSDIGIFNIYKIFNDKLSWTYQFMTVLSKNKIPTLTFYYGDIPKYPLINYILRLYRF
jgi:2-polyprenyl-3-methyl-5-hydroxy-6-metoxy-1,4-benzoquinol methylase